MRKGGGAEAPRGLKSALRTKKKSFSDCELAQRERCACAFAPYTSIVSKLSESKKKRLRLQ